MDKKTITEFTLCFFLGGLIGAILMSVSLRYLKEQEGLSAYYMASKYYEEKEYSDALIPLSYAIAKLQNYYGPVYLAGKIYESSGNNKLALSMYQKALELINSKNEKDKKTNFDKQNIEKQITKFNKRERNYQSD